MGTITYFERGMKDEASDKVIHVEAGTTGFAGNGPQLFLSVGSEKFILSHQDAREFYEQVVQIARYLGYDSPNDR